MSEQQTQAPRFEGPELADHESAMTIEHNLSLRPSGENDYLVMREGRAIGRIRLADERPVQETWVWSITVPLPIPAFGVGRASSMEAAKAAFRAAWTQFYAQLTPHDIQHWHHHQNGARERAEWLGWT
jgi:hypothetical protein